MVEWIVVCAALTVLDDEIIMAAERAGLPLAAPGPPPSARQGPPQARMMQPQPSMRGPPSGPPRQQPQSQRSLPPQGLIPGQPDPRQVRGPPPGSEGYYPPGAGRDPRADPRADPRNDPRMMDPRYAQQDPRLTPRGEPYAGAEPHGGAGPSRQAPPPIGYAAPPPQRHQLRDEPPAPGSPGFMPPQGGRQAVTAPRSFVPPSKRPSREDGSARGEMPAIEGLSITTDPRPESPLGLPYDSSPGLPYDADPHVATSPTSPIGGNPMSPTSPGGFSKAPPAMLNPVVLDYASLAADPSGYQAEPVAAGAAMGYQAEGYRPQPQRIQQADRNGGGRSMPPGAAPAQHYHDPRMAAAGRGGPGPTRGMSRDAYGSPPPQAQPYAEHTQNGFAHPPQGIARPPNQGYSPAPPPQALQSQPPARAMPPPGPPASPPPPDPLTPEFLVWVASREEHRWPDEPQPPSQAPQGAPPPQVGRSPTAYRAGGPPGGQRGYAGPQGAYKGSSGNTGDGMGMPPGMGQKVAGQGGNRLQKQRAR